jgi:hypothetical protein
MNCKICNNAYHVLSSDGICIDCIENRSELVRAYRENRMIKVVRCNNCDSIQTTSATKIFRCKVCKKVMRISSLKIIWYGNDAHQAIQVMRGFR